MSDHHKHSEKRKTEREAIRDELLAEGKDELARVASALAKQAVEEEAPPMPESLEAKVRERYGEKEAAPAAEAEKGGFGELVRGFFARPLPASGMLATAACVLLAVAMLNGPEGSLVVRGGGSDGGESGALVIMIGEAAVEGIAESALMKAMDEADGAAILEAQLDRERIVVRAGEGVVRGYRAGGVDAVYEGRYGEGETLLDVIAEAEERLRASE